MDGLLVKKISYAVATLGLVYFMMNAGVTAHASNGLFDCCHAHLTKPLPVSAIKSFTIQRSGEVCMIDSIIFSTKKGRKLCADPNDAWVKKVMRILRKNKKN